MIAVPPLIILPVVIGPTPAPDEGRLHATLLTPPLNLIPRLRIHLILTRRRFNPDVADIVPEPLHIYTLRPTAAPIQRRSVNEGERWFPPHTQGMAPFRRKPG